MNSFEKLKAKLAELFQLDQADLDFGIYRIMNARREEIIRFLDRDLLPQVREAFAEYKSADKAQIQAELDKVIEGLKAGGVDPEQAPKVQELRAKLATDAVDVSALENEVYDHLYSFFSRYYDEGDFISLRRYKEGVYAIPYEGEEVKLHWANADQYYIKTTENFRDYAFHTPSGHRVHFKIAEADTEKDNVKAANGKDRRFLLHGDKPVVEENGELVIRFEYRPDGESRKQDAINTDTVRRVIEDLNDDKLAIWQHRLSAKWHRADGMETDRTILEKRLDDCTKKNTFDYFIHKDLGGFLRRELDFYIKNEVMRLDDIEEESAPRVEQYLSKIKALRRIAHKIIDFLAQIENFQKRLWLKKKFVVETNYCVTLDRVPEELHAEIAANDAQREEWVRLYAINEIEKDLAGAIAYSEPLTVEFLKANRSLVLDTTFFSDDFKSRLLASVADLCEETDGVLLNADSFQGLNLLTPVYKGRIECIYIDPPYNTGGDGFVYKDSYQHSTWLSMLADRIPMAERLIDQCSFLYCSVDDHECARCKLILDATLSSGEFVSDIAVVNNLKGRQDRAHVATAHEHLLFYAGSNAKSRGLPLSAERLAKFDQTDDRGFAYELRDLRRRGGGDRRQDRPKMFFPIYWDKVTRTASLKRRAEHEVEIYPKRSDGSDGRWRWGPARVKSNLSIIEARETPDGKKWNVYYRIYLQDENGVERRTKPKSVWLDPKYSTDVAGKTLKRINPGTGFKAPKPVGLIADILHHSIHDGGTILDFTAGTGTTGHSVIDLTRSSKVRAHYVLIEMSETFNTDLKPRIVRVVYSGDWKKGRPRFRDSGISHIFKYIRLESYEDALANIALRRTKGQQTLLDGVEGFRESYMLRYMLDVESRDSQTLLNIDHFDDPFSYKLLVGTGSAGETKPVNVDLVETFNWLLGLKVRHIDCIEGFHIVDGTSPKDDRVLVIWRKIRDLSETDPAKIAVAREQANNDLDAFFRKQQYNTLDSEYNLIYVNGDNNLMNVPLDPDKEGVEPRYKVRLIEEEFKKLMFDVKDV